METYLTQLGIFSNTGIRFLSKILHEIHTMKNKEDYDKILLSDLEDATQRFIDKMRKLEIILEIEETNLIVKDKYLTILFIVDYTKQRY